MKIEDVKGKLFQDNYIDIAVEEYLKFKESNEYGEKYKELVLKKLNDYLNNKRITAGNVLEVIKEFQNQNPPSGSFVHWKCLFDLLNFVTQDPFKVAELLNFLYEDSGNLNLRIKRFIDSAKDYNPRGSFGTPLVGYLLAGYDMRRYPLYKDDAFKDFLKSFGIDEFSKDVAEKYYNYYLICKILIDYFEKKGYIKNPSMLDAQDFIFCITSYKELMCKIAVKYLYGHAKMLHTFEEDITEFIDYINNLPKDYIVHLKNKYSEDKKVNLIRFKIAEMLLQNRKITVKDFEELKNDVQNKSEKNILKPWSDFGILFPFYYDRFKEKVNIELKKIYNAVKSIEHFSDFEFKENKYICDFEGPANFGSSICGIALYPKDKETHKTSAQLLFDVSAEGVRYGLYVGSELQLRINGKTEDIEIITNIEDFSFSKVEEKLVDVFDRFKELNYSEQHNEVSTHEGKKLEISVDFDKTLRIENLFFEDEEVLLKRISTALKSGKHIILIGPPGTGKTKLAKEICKSYGVEYEMVTAMSDWSTYDTIGGYKPDIDGSLFFDEGVFLRLFKDKNSKTLTNKWIIIDEINRADIDKAFGALFSVITGQRVILSFKTKEGENIIVRPQEGDDDIYPKDHEYIVPRDFRIIGTMNTFDKTSLYEMSYAFMRRFAFIPVTIPKNIDGELVEKYLRIWGIEDRSINNISLKEGLAKVWEITNRYRKIGPGIIEDVARYVSIEGDYTSAVILYTLPQFEGLLENEIKNFVEELCQSEVDDFAKQKEKLKDFVSDFFGISF